MKRLLLIPGSLFLLTCFHITVCAQQQGENSNRILFGGDEPEEKTKTGCNETRRILFGGDDGAGGNDDADDRGEEDDDTPHEGEYSKYDWDAPQKISATAGFFSMFGSLWILIEILRDRKKKNLAYHRLMFGLSLFDFIASTCFFVTPLFVIKDQWLGFTSPSCEAVGFFTYWSSLCIPLYNAALATYFYLAIKNGWREDQIKQRFEKHIHIFVPVVTLLVAISALPLNMYNLYNNTCFAVLGDGRGTLTLHDTFLGIFWGTVLFSAFWVILFMILLYRHVVRILSRNSRYDFERGTEIAEKNNAGSRQSDSQANISEPRNKKLAKRVRNMALLYSIPFTTTWVVSVIWQIMQQTAWTNQIQMKPLTVYVMQVWIALFLPLQGFFNWIVYMIPRFQRVRRENSSARFLQIVLKVFAGISRSSSQNNHYGNDRNMKDDDDESMVGELFMSHESPEIVSNDESNGEDRDENKAQVVENEEVLSA